MHHEPQKSQTIQLLKKIQNSTNPVQKQEQRSQYSPVAEVESFLGQKSFIFRFKKYPEMEKLWKKRDDWDWKKRKYKRGPPSYINKEKKKNQEDRDKKEFS